MLLTRDELRRQLLPVPVECLGWPAAILNMLRQMGIRTLGECMRLPRQGFARRFGPARLHELDQAFGRSPELRRAHVAPAHFAETRNCRSRRQGSPPCWRGFERLLSRLGACLKSAQMSTDTLRCQLRHPDGSDTELRIRLCRPAAGTAAFAELLRLRLEAVVLPAPVTLLVFAGQALDRPAGHRQRSARP
jgi:protein ImuB